MKRQRVIVFGGHDGIADPIPLQPQQRFQCEIQPFSDSFAMIIRVQVDGRLGAPTVCGSAEGGAGIGVACDPSVFLPYEPGQLLGVFREAI